MAASTTAPTTSHVITANDLKNGLVVYLAADNSWTASFAGAEVLDGADALKSAMDRGQTAEHNQLVVGPYAIDVDLSGAAPRPVRYREQIRAYGPSTHPEFGHDNPSNTNQPETPR